jgi:Asp/Glu/hydantoin racemase
VKILWHTFTNPDRESPYTEQLIEFVEAATGADVAFDFVGLDPPDRHIHRITEMRAGAQVVANLIEAEEAGYDAVVVGHFQDPGLWDARGALEIPVLGLGETSMLHGCMFGRRIGLVTISPAFIPWHEEQIHRYHLDGRVTDVAAIDADVALFMSAFAGDATAYAHLKSQFQESARGLAAAGAEIIIPAGGLPALLFHDDRSFDLGGATLLDPVLTLAKQAEVVASVRELTGFGTSRASTFARATPEARREFVEQLSGHARPLSPAAPAD